MHPVLIAKLLVLLSIANGMPVLIKRAFRERFSHPLDLGARFMDGRRVFGPSKTIRGALASLMFTTAAAPLLGLEPIIGALTGSMAVIGDLLSSFLKRRLDFAPSSQAIDLDQIPEALCPMLVCALLLPLSALDVILVVAAFSVAVIVFSPVLHRVGIRDRPF
jgi:CDP-diglyceride synthetase